MARLERRQRQQRREEKESKEEEEETMRVSPCSSQQVEEVTDTVSVAQAMTEDPTEHDKVESLSITQSTSWFSLYLTGPYFH